MSSSRYNEMKSNIADLRKNLLPEIFDPTGNYQDPEKVSTLALSFRVLSHAEMESYIEDMAISATDTAWKAWSRYGVATRTALSLLAFSGAEMSLPPDTIRAKQPNQEKTWSEKVDLSTKLKNSIVKYNNFIKRKNHGIKEENMLAILLPIGIMPEEIDQMLLADLNSFGESRGMAAHSNSKRATQGIDPKSELDKVIVITESLLEIDSAILRLFQKPRASSKPKNN